MVTDIDEPTAGAEQLHYVAHLGVVNLGDFMRLKLVFGDKFSRLLDLFGQFEILLDNFKLILLDQLECVLWQGVGDGLHLFAHQPDLDAHAGV